MWSGAQDGPRSIFYPIRQFSCKVSVNQCRSIDLLLLGKWSANRSTKKWLNIKINSWNKSISSSMKKMTVISNSWFCCKWQFLSVTYNNKKLQKEQWIKSDCEVNNEPVKPLEHFSCQECRSVFVRSIRCEFNIKYAERGSAMDMFPPIRKLLRQL